MATESFWAEGDRAEVHDGRPRWHAWSANNTSSSAAARSWRRSLFVPRRPRSSSTLISSIPAACAGVARTQDLRLDVDGPGLVAAGPGLGLVAPRHRWASPTLLAILFLVNLVAAVVRTVRVAQQWRGAVRTAGSEPPRLDDYCTRAHTHTHTHTHTYTHTHTHTHTPTHPHTNADIGLVVLAACVCGLWARKLPFHQGERPICQRRCVLCCV